MFYPGQHVKVKRDGHYGIVTLATRQFFPTTERYAVYLIDVGRVETYSRDDLELNEDFKNTPPVSIS